MDNTTRFKAIMNNGKAVHLCESRLQEDGTYKTFPSCGQRPTDSYGDYFYVTKQQVTCKKCWKMLVSSTMQGATNG
jgi:hypothetical protein